MLVVDHVVFGGVEADYSGQEHHGVGEGESWGEESGRCEDVDDVHVAHPGLVELLGVHVGIHLVLFLVEVVDGLEEAEVELGSLLGVLAFHVLAYLEEDQGRECSHDGGEEVNHNQGQQLRRHIVVAVVNAA